MSRAFAFCPNVRCFATKDSQLGTSWRWINDGPKNCKKCHFAFLLGREHWRYTGGSRGGKPTGTTGAKRSPVTDVDTSQPKAEDSDEVLRKQLLKKFKAEGMAATDAQSKVDDIIPPKPLTPEEEKEKLQKKLEKAKVARDHESRKYCDMQASLKRQGQAFLDYKAEVAEQEAVAQTAKLLYEQVQLEWDGHVAKEARQDHPDAANGARELSLTGVLTRELGRQQLEGFDAVQSKAVLLPAVEKLLTNPEIISAILATFQGGTQQQQHQQQQQQDHVQQQHHQQHARPDPAAPGTPAASSPTAPAANIGSTTQQQPVGIRQSGTSSAASAAQHALPPPAAPPPRRADVVKDDDDQDADMQIQRDKAARERDDSADDMFDDDGSEEHMQEHKRRMLDGNADVPTQHGTLPVLQAAERLAMQVGAVAPAEAGIAQTVSGVGKSGS